MNLEGSVKFPLKDPTITKPILNIVINSRVRCTDQDNNTETKTADEVEEENLRREQEARENISRTLDNVLRGYNRNIRPNLNGM